jgi:hypothetical protein
MYLQTLYQKKNIDGHVSRANHKSLQTLSQIDFLIKNKDAKKIEEILRNLSVKYIIVNYNYNTRDSFLQLKDLIKNIRLIEKCEKFEVYEIY